MSLGQSPAPILMRGGWFGWEGTSDVWHSPWHEGGWLGLPWAPQCHCHPQAWAVQGLFPMSLTSRAELRGNKKRKQPLKSPASPTCPLCQASQVKPSLSNCFFIFFFGKKNNKSVLFLPVGTKHLSLLLQAAFRSDLARLLELVGTGKESLSFMKKRIRHLAQQWLRAARRLEQKLKGRQRDQKHVGAACRGVLVWGWGHGVFSSSGCRSWAVFLWVLVLLQQQDWTRWSFRVPSNP